MRAIVAKRVDRGPVDTEEIRGLAKAAGHTVVDAVTQVRAEDPGLSFGEGKVAEIADRIEETEASMLVVDGRLTPNQHLAVQESLPTETTVRDRYRLILDVFAEQARHRRAQLQVELAQLRYDLPRIREGAEEGLLNTRTESGSPLYDVRDRIDELQRKLDERPDPAEKFRRRRREEGFDLVTLAGYTNAGKSTLLHRLADDLSLDDAEPDHPDAERVAAIENRLFETLETTTRRATIRGRPTLVTDTVGFVRDLPHWLVESFSETLSEAAAADVVVLVADASDPLAEFREKLRVSLDALDGQGVDVGDVVPALNKVDLLEPDAVVEREAAAAELVGNPVSVSVKEGTNVDRLIATIREGLPSETVELRMPNCEAAMSLVSWVYDRASVEDVEYGAETVRVTATGRPDVVERARARAESIG